MVRFVTLNRIDILEGQVDFEALKRAPLLFFDRLSPALGAELETRGISASPIPEDGVPDGSIVLLCTTPFYDLVHVSSRLLGPGGCPWDQAQTHESLKRFLLEEAYEVLDAIDLGSEEKLQEELGDLLLQPVMHAQMKAAAGSFDIDEVATQIVEKLVRRHPHVFGDTLAANSEEVLRNWDEIKRLEKGAEPQSILSGVPKGMSSLLRAFEVSKRTQRVGFEWPNIGAVFNKLHEEEKELLSAIEAANHEEVESELGDFLFTIVNIARWSNVEPEEALRKMVNRFTARFMHMESSSRRPLRDLSASEWDDLWIKAKAATKASTSSSKVGGNAGDEGEHN